MLCYYSMLRSDTREGTGVFRRTIGAVMLGLLAACQSLQGEDVPATMRADLTLYATEAAAIQAQLVARRTEAAATIQAAGTQAADFFHYNNVLVATVRAVIPPTPAERLAVAVESSGGASEYQVNEMGMATELEQIGISSFLSPEDGCFETQSTVFNMNTVETLYLTARAVSMQAGTRLEADWDFNGQMMYRSSWIAQISQMDLCISLRFSSADVPFQAGNWTVTLFVNEALVTRIAFEMVTQ